MVMASTRATASVAPATAFTLSRSPAPQACPISTVAPVLRPMTKANRKNITGKNTETAASASTPIIWPSSALLTVPNSDCSALLSIRGVRKTRKVFQREGDFDPAGVPAVDMTDHCRAPERWRMGGPWKFGERRPRLGLGAIAEGEFDDVVADIVGPAGDETDEAPPVIGEQRPRRFL